MTCLVKNLPAKLQTWVWSLGWEDLLEEGWQPTPVFLPGESQGQRILVGYSLWDRKESYMTEWLSTAQHMFLLGRNLLSLRIIFQAKRIESGSLMFSICPIMSALLITFLPCSLGPELLATFFLPVESKFYEGGHFCLFCSLRLSQVRTRVWDQYIKNKLLILITGCMLVCLVLYDSLWPQGL